MAVILLVEDDPRIRTALTRALKTRDPVKVAATCISTVKVWDEIGAWPDDWSAWQRALDDVLPWRQHVQLQDVAYGRVTIRSTNEED